MSKPHKKQTETIVPVISVPENELSALDSLRDTGIPCKYARFTQAIAPAENLEPVYELKIDPKAQAKYRVDWLIYTKAGLLFQAHGEKTLVPPGMFYVRPL